MTHLLMVVLDGNVPYRLIYLYTWSSVGRTVWGGLRDAPPMKQVKHGCQALSVRSLSPFPVCSLLPTAATMPPACYCALWHETLLSFWNHKPK